MSEKQLIEVLGKSFTSWIKIYDNWWVGPEGDVIEEFNGKWYAIGWDVEDDIEKWFEKGEGPFESAEGAIQFLKNNKNEEIH